MKQRKLKTTAQILDFININHGMSYMRCKVNDYGDFYDYEISDKLFGNYVKIDWLMISYVVNEVYQLYADGYYISKIFG